MNLTDTQLELLFTAWALAREDKGAVIADDAYPDAHELAEHGWLERRFVDRAGEMSWHWTRQAETTLDLSALLHSTAGREN